MTPATATDKGDQTRRHILAVAATAFAESGYAGTSLNDLIRATGLTKGGFYFHFASKEHLALEVLRVKRDDWMHTVLAEASQHERAFDQLEAVAKALADTHVTDPAAGAVRTLCIELSHDPELEPVTNEHIKTWVAMTADIIRRAQIEGDVRPEIDALAVADLCVCAFIGMEQISDLHQDGPSLRDRVDVFTAVIRDALRIR
jgi:AcrR family transcriptional regulator